MPNKPGPAWEARSKPALPPRNAQDVHEGSAHNPQEFLKGKPPAAPQDAAKPDEKPDTTAEALKSEHYFGSQAWEATSPLEQEAADEAPAAKDQNQRNK